MFSVAHSREFAFHSRIVVYVIETAIWARSCLCELLKKFAGGTGVANFHLIGS